MDKHGVVVRPTTGTQSMIKVPMSNKPGVI